MLPVAPHTVHAISAFLLILAVTPHILCDTAELLIPTNLIYQATVHVTPRNEKHNITF